MPFLQKWVDFKAEYFQSNGKEEGLLVIPKNG